MSGNTSGWLVPLLLVVACMALVIHIFHNKKVNSTLVTNIDTAQADLKVATDNSQDSSNKLEAKITELAAKNTELLAKDEQMANLTDSVNTLTLEKAKILHELAQSMNELTQLKKQAETTNLAVEEVNEAKQVQEA